jgi:hypothetical protein
MHRQPVTRTIFVCLFKIVRLQNIVPRHRLGHLPFVPFCRFVLFMCLVWVGLFCVCWDASSEWPGLPDFAQAGAHCISIVGPTSPAKKVSYFRRTR